MLARRASMKGHRSTPAASWIKRKPPCSYHRAASVSMLSEGRPRVLVGLARVKSKQRRFAGVSDRGESGWPGTTVRHERRHPHPLGDRAGRPPGRRATPARWSTTSCASWPRRGWPGRSPGRRSRPRPWSTRPTSGWSGREDPGWDGRGHFFAAAAEAMRRILVENARRKAAAKAGGGRERVDLAEAEPAIEGPGRRPPGPGRGPARPWRPRTRGRPSWSSSATSPG